MGEVGSKAAAFTNRSHTNKSLKNVFLDSQVDMETAEAIDFNLNLSQSIQTYPEQPVTPMGGTVQYCENAPLIHDGKL